MDVALCYESVLPARGGAETYIGDLARRLARDGHAVHLYACRWDPASLPAVTHYHKLDVPGGPRFPRPRRPTRGGPRRPAGWERIPRGSTPRGPRLPAALGVPRRGGGPPPPPPA